MDIKKQSIDEIVANWKKRYSIKPILSGRPDRDTVITKDDITNLIIDINLNL